LGKACENQLLGVIQRHKSSKDTDLNLKIRSFVDLLAAYCGRI
jgi:hypothetical protein